MILNYENPEGVLTMEKRNRSKAITAAAFLALLLLCAAPAGAEVTGEIGAHGIGTDQTEGKLNHYREYRNLPQGMSLSLVDVQFPLLHSRGGYFRFHGTDIGEGDVSALFQAGLGRSLTLQGGYDKTPHMLSITGNYHTIRDAEHIRANLFPLGKVNFSASYSNEDKTGRLNNAVYVGQKARDKSFDANGTLGDAVISFGIKDAELQHSTVAHEQDGMGLTITLNPKNIKRLYGVFSYDEQEYDPSMTNAARTLELKRMDLAGAYALRRNVTLTSNLSSYERSSSSLGTVSYDDDALGFGVNVRSKLGSKLALKYKIADRDYTNAGITNRETSTFNIKGSTRWYFMGIKAEYEKAHRDVSGGSTTTLWNFSQLPGESIDQNYSVSLLGFKRFFGMLYATNNKDSYTPMATYGTTGRRTVTNGFTSVYNYTPNLDLTLDISNMENRTLGRQRFWMSDANGNALRDFTLGIDYDTRYFMIGSNYYFEPGATFTFGYSTASSNLYDVQDSNQVRERTVSLGVEKQLTKKHMLTAGLSRTYYSDLLDTTFSSKNTVLEFEILRKF